MVRDSENITCSIKIMVRDSDNDTGIIKVKVRSATTTQASR